MEDLSASSSLSSKSNDYADKGGHEVQNDEKTSSWFEEFFGKDQKWSLALNGPKSVFIIGGGDGSTAREVLKHKDLSKVIMCEIDERIAKFSLTKDFTSSLTMLKLSWRNRQKKFDVIIGDFADPIEPGPYNKLYTESFYEKTLKPKLAEQGGIFVTLAGFAGIVSHKEAFTSIYNTLKQVFKYVVAHVVHVPSFADSTGFILASDEALELDAGNLDKRIAERIEGELHYLDGSVILASTYLNNTLRNSLSNETHIYTEERQRV